jgi:nitrile hydratase accessory protein
MSAIAAPTLLDVDGPAAPPRSNGELIFTEPWESKAFGLALALHAAGTFSWEQFRQQLISVIGSWEAQHHPDDGWSYYGCWMTALEELLIQQGLLGRSELEDRAAVLAARPHGHDHRHR